MNPARILVELHLWPASSRIIFHLYTLCSVLSSQLLIQSATRPSIPCAFNLNIRRLCGSLSKALAKSRKIMSTLTLSSLKDVTLSRKKQVETQRMSKSPSKMPIYAEKICDMRTLLKYGAIAYLHKTDMCTVWISLLHCESKKQDTKL